MLRNYLKTLPSTKIVKTKFPSKNTGKGLYEYLIYLLKNHPVNIVISTNYRLLIGANKTTARNFDSDNRRQNELRHFAQNWVFLRFINFKRRKLIDGEQSQKQLSSLTVIARWIFASEVSLRIKTLIVRHINTTYFIWIYQKKLSLRSNEN